MKDVSTARFSILAATCLLILFSGLFITTLSDASGRATYPALETPTPTATPTCLPGDFSEGFESGLPISEPLPTHAPPGASLMLASGTWHALNNSIPIGDTGVFGSQTTVFPPRAERRSPV